MKSFKTYLIEVKVGRAWNGNIKRIDSLMSWMYDKGILNKGEQAKKDALFRKYYRYYNDGDTPRGLTRNGESVPVALERQLEDFIKKVLAKYLPKIDRTEFRYDNTISKLKTIINIVNDLNVTGLIRYWKKDIKDPEILKLIASLEKKYNKFDNEAAKVSPEHKGLTIEYRIREMKKSGGWNSSLNDAWISIQKDMIDIENLISNVLLSVQKLKKLRALGIN